MNEEVESSSDPSNADQVIRSAKRVLDRPAATMSLGARLDSLAKSAPGVYDITECADVYGDGVVAHLERRVARMLGKEDAAFFPTGTMAQQVTLRCWAERSGNRRVALHALSHPEVFEGDAFRKVSGLEPVRITAAARQPTADEVRGLSVEIGALMLELPLRDVGYVLPSWEELEAVVAAARERDAIVHIDGARLWECTTHFERSLSDIAALADSVYVSLYKSLKGLSGAVVAGPRSLIDETRRWRHRYGGRVFHQFPAALSALAGLDCELPLLPDYVRQAKMVAAAITEGFRAAGLGWFRVQPEEPHIQQFQVWLPADAGVLWDAAIRQAEETDVALFQFPWWEPGVPPGISVTEVTVGAAASEWEPADVRAAAQAFVGYLRRG
jgi:threonine aldolase